MTKSRFKSLKMVEFSARLRKFNPINFHSSNPQEFSINELNKLLNENILAIDSQQQLGYVASEGNESLRCAISLLFTQISYQDILTTSGAQEAIYCCIHALLETNDNVLAITPIFEPLILTAQEIGCNIITQTLEPKKVWELDLNKLEQNLKQGIKLLIINFPHNPTGALLTSYQLNQIISLCDKYNCWLLSDEVFRGLEHKENKRLPCVADIYPKGISIGVLSKSFALPAIRIGWIASQNNWLKQRLIEIKNYLSICNSLIDSIISEKIIQQHQKIWQRNREIILANKLILNKYINNNSEYFSYSEPEAGCLAFPIFKPFSVEHFAEKLVQTNKLLVLPGYVFNTPINGFRLSLGSKDFNEKLKYLK
jgi:aspartate/methionine/tyrosine aminotransferase